jgi:signal transduction histidine kinase
VIDQYQQSAEQKNIQIHFDCPHPISVTADEPKIRQVVSNVLSNAVKFSDGGTVRVSLTHGKGEVLCQVTDSGRGIAKKILPRVFDRFFQGQEGTKGTGIGLTIAKAWVDAHGGQIWAESEGEGKGTTVTFTLPVA